MHVDAEDRELRLAQQSEVMDLDGSPVEHDPGEAPEHDERRERDDDELTRKWTIPTTFTAATTSAAPMQATIATGIPYDGADTAKTAEAKATAEPTEMSTWPATSRNVCAHATTPTTAAASRMLERLTGVRKNWLADAKKMTSRMRTANLTSLPLRRSRA